MRILDSLATIPTLNGSDQSKVLISTVIYKYYYKQELLIVVIFGHFTMALPCNNAEEHICIDFYLLYNDFI